MREREVRSYGHFCMLAKALEHVGDRWTLLVVRDLRSGPKRFTDLMERLAGITPKTLTQRLRELEADGLVEVDRVAGRREVRYRLSTAGEDLAPALDALLLWGMHHLMEAAGPDEPIHPEHALRGLTVLLQSEGVDVGTVRWKMQLPGTDPLVLTGDRGRWELRIEGESEATADVTITGTRSGLVRFLTKPRSRNVDADDVVVIGKPAAVRTFLKAIEVFPPNPVLTGAR